MSPEERMECIGLITEATLSGARVEEACEVLDLSPRTLERWKSAPEGRDDRAGPNTPSKAALSDSEKAMIVEVIQSLRFRDKSPWQIVATLADDGVYLASESSFYRVMRERELLTHRGRATRVKAKRPSPLIARHPNEIWSWDITYLLSPIAGMFFRLYMVMDIFSRKIVGWEVHERESAELAADLIARICREEGIQPGQLTIHADNGGPMKGATLLATLQRLAVAPSHSRPRVSDDNPFSESLFKTLKYVPSYPDGPFESLEQARAWVAKFVAWYNTEHLHSEIEYVTPESRHEGLDGELLKKRKQVYEKARKQTPERWSGKCRSWKYIDEVVLNGRNNSSSQARSVKPRPTAAEQTREVALAA